MKRILIVNNNLKIGGVQKSLINLLAEIHNDYEITLFLFNSRGEYLVDVPNNVRVLQAKPALRVIGMSLSDCRSEGLIYLLIKALLVATTKLFTNRIAIKIALIFEPSFDDFDASISYMQPAPKNIYYGGTNEYVLQKTKATQKISYIHSDFENYGGDIRYSEKLYSRFDKLVFCSIGCKNSFDKVLNVPSVKCFVVYNCHNHRQILTESKTNTVYYDKKKLNIVLVARLTYDKGIDTSIYAIERYRKYISPDIHLHIIGDGIHANDFKQLVDRLQLNNFVTFYGNQKNPYRYMKNADLLILTSHHEAAPMVFGEAEILSLPVLATETTSTDELIVKPRTGIVCVNNIDSIVSGLTTFSTRKFTRISSSRTQRTNEKAIVQFKRMLEAK